MVPHDLGRNVMLAPLPTRGPSHPGVSLLHRGLRRKGKCSQNLALKIHFVELFLFVLKSYTGFHFESPIYNTVLVCTP